MVGGRIWHVAVEPGARLLLVNGTRGDEVGDWLCIRVAAGGEPLKPGDRIWWQGREAFWTPEPREGREDVPIRRIGYSFSVPNEMRGLMNERRGASVQ